MTDPVALAQALIRCPSVTPHDGGALSVLEAALTPLGFACHRLRFEDKDTPPVENLYARWGTGRPHFCFAGHTDVVPEGARALWSVDPYAGALCLYLRGEYEPARACFEAIVARDEPRPEPRRGRGSAPARPRRRPRALRPRSRPRSSPDGC